MTILIIPLAFKPVGSHMHTATGGGWLYIVSKDIRSGRWVASVGGDIVHQSGCASAALIASQGRHTQNVRGLFDERSER